MTSRELPTLGHALTPPLGMRDLLPPESRARRRVGDALQTVFERAGYELVTTPLFERFEVFERGSSLDPRDSLRFIDPDSGEVAALRPDITPQIARVVSTRLGSHPAPFRLRYEGTVIRRRRGRARKQRQIAQVGIELIGLGGGDADHEVIDLTAAACLAAGLDTFRVELSEVGVGRSLLESESDSLLAAAADALARKDGALLMDVLERSGVSKKNRDSIAELAHLHGDLSVIKEAKKLVRGTSAEAHLARLAEVADRLVESGLGPRLGVDLGEIRGAAYYTGVSFALFAEGPGEVIASGGRYDQLVGRYGPAQPATGAGIDLENLLWALDAQGLSWRERPFARFIVHGKDAGAVQRVTHSLRSADLTAASLPVGGSDALAYARAWGYDVVVACVEQGTVATRVSDARTHASKGDLGPAEIAALVDFSRPEGG